MTANEATGREAPAWFRSYARSYTSGEAHAFLLSGDVEGTAFENVAVRRLLLANVAAKRDVVAVYHLAGGITLFDEEATVSRPGELRVTRRQRAMQILGLDRDRGRAGGTDATPAGGMASIIAAAAPQGAPQDPFAAAQSPTDALALLGRLLREGTTERDGQIVGCVAVVIDYADLLVPAPAMAGAGAMSPADRRVLATLLAWAKDGAIGANGNPVFLLCRDAADIHPAVRAGDSGWKSIRIALPDRDARQGYLDWYLGQRPLALRDGLTTGELANLTAGLSLRNVENILLVADQEGGMTRRLLKAFKDEIVTSEYSEVAEMIDPLPGGFADLGGAAIFKDYCLRRIVAPVRAGKMLNVPRGVMLVGPPGTSKTYGVRGLAGEIGWTCVALQSSKILGGIVGQSERNLARFLGFARALAPVIIFVDEIDQSDLAQRGDQSGNPVAKNLFSGLMQFMSDETVRGKVVTIFASNRPDKIDPALKRSGRIDAIIPMLLPGRDERREIAAAQAAAQGVGITAQALDLVADRTENWNAGDLAEIVREARLLAEECGEDTISIDEAGEALDDLRPSGLDVAEQFTLLAVQAVNKKRLLPPAYRALLDDRAVLDAQIADTQPAPAGADAPRRAREW